MEREVDRGEGVVTDGGDSSHRPDNLDAFETAFDGVHGVGPATCRRLATEFGTVDALLAADDDRIALSVGDRTSRADGAAITVLKGVDELREERESGDGDVATDGGDTTVTPTDLATSCSGCGKDIQHFLPEARELGWCPQCAPECYPIEGIDR